MLGSNLYSKVDHTKYGFELVLDDIAIEPATGEMFNERFLLNTNTFVFVIE